MTATDTTTITHDGTSLRLRVYRPETPPRGVIVITHGHGEHLGRYNHIGEALCGAGHVVYTYDLRGHGRSGGKKGHSPSFLTYVDDLYEVHDLASRTDPAPRLWLMGHSMGGLITLTYALRRAPQAAGVVVTSPLLRAKFEPPAWKVTMAQLLGGLLPSLTVSTGLDVSVPMSHDEAFLKAMPDQDLPHALMSMRVGADLLHVMEDTLAAAPHMTLPLLMLQGEADGAVDPKATRQFYDQAGSRDKFFKLYPGLYHEIMNENERERVLDDILAWLEKRSRSQPEERSAR
jgi:alpha-beta hydrolase superfamily lysophospholipase